MLGIYLLTCLGCGFMVFNATFNKISVISWRSVLLVEKTGVPGETTDLPHVTDKLDHIILYQVHLAWAEFELTTLVVIGTGSIGSYKSNYQTITTTTAPVHMFKSNFCWLKVIVSWQYISVPISQTRWRHPI